MLTEFQQYALDRIKQYSPDWFFPDDLPRVVRRPEHTCRILEDKGLLERRYVTGAIQPQFRIMRDGEASPNPTVSLPHHSGLEETRVMSAASREDNIATHRLLDEALGSSGARMTIRIEELLRERARMLSDLAALHQHDADQRAALAGAQAEVERATRERDRLRKVYTKVLEIFNDPRYLDGWNDAEILTYLLAALDPWYPYAADAAGEGRDIT